jgi:hypothetical protein
MSDIMGVSIIKAPHNLSLWKLDRPTTDSLFHMPSHPTIITSLLNKILLEGTEDNKETLQQ